MSTIQSPSPAPTGSRAVGARSSAPTRPRGWAVAGLVAGAAGLGGIAASMMSDGVYQPQLAGDAEAIVEMMAADVPQLLVFHLATMLAVVLLPVVAAGLHRRLRASVPEDSLLPVVAGAGLGLVAVAGLMGTALNTEFILQLGAPEVVAEVLVMYGYWVGTVAWLWVGAGISGVALAAASFRYRAVPRWIGVVGLVLGGLTLLVGISPLQYMAGFVGPVWLLVTSLGFLFGDRAHDASVQRG
jgi:hypothetical protein